MAKGRCLSGALNYELEGPFSATIHCHCSMCRKHQGTGFATFVVGPITGFRWISGEDRLRRCQSSPSGVGTFCSVRGSAGPARRRATVVREGSESAQPLAMPWLADLRTVEPKVLSEHE